MFSWDVTCVYSTRQLLGIEEQEQPEDSETSSSEIQTLKITSKNDSSQDNIPVNETTTNEEIQEDIIEDSNEEEAQELRCSERSRQLPDYYGVWVNAVAKTR